MDITIERLKDFQCNLMYENEEETGAIITNYTPAIPVVLRPCVKTVHGFSYFQNSKKQSDCKIKFQAAFQIKGETEEETKNNINKFLKFRNSYQDRFIFKDEFGTLYKGYFQGTYNIDTKIEGDIYYFSLELLCNHDISGWKKDNDKL